MRRLALALTLAAASAAGAEEACAASPAAPSLVDITATIDVTLPTWEKPDGLGADHRTLSSSHEDGDDANVSELRLRAHTGTHVDAPRHFSRDDSTPIDRLPLEWIDGPALVVDAFDVPALDAASLDALHLPRGVSRVIFRTENTRRDLMRRTPFHEEYVGFTEDKRAVARRRATGDSRRAASTTSPSRRTNISSPRTSRCWTEEWCQSRDSSCPRRRSARGGGICTARR